jgi:site-specific DNA-methyltransferase (adenine-specific)
VQGAAVVYSSARSDWRTPVPLFRELHDEFAFTLDVCASEQNKLCDRYIGPDHRDPVLRDAIACSWGRREVCFMNPPYSRDEGILIDPFVAAAHEESTQNLVVALLPSRTDTRWWHTHVMLADEVRLIPHRVKFCRPDGAEAADTAGFPSVVVIWRPRWNMRGCYPRFVTWDYR